MCMTLLLTHEFINHLKKYTLNALVSVDFFFWIITNDESFNLILICLFSKIIYNLCKKFNQFFSILYIKKIYRKKLAGFYVRLKL